MHQTNHGSKGSAFQILTDVCRRALRLCRCRASNGPCDPPEFCGSSTAACPADKFVVAGTTCRWAGASMRTTTHDSLPALPHSTLVEV